MSRLHEVSSPEKDQRISIIGVRDLVARGYVIPGGASQRGGTGSDVSVSHVVRPGLYWTQVDHL